MTSNRAQAYGRVMKTVADLAAAKLHPDEQELIRDAADTMFFCERLEIDEVALDTVARMRDLAIALVEGGRLMADTVDQLLGDIEGCGPQPVAAI